MSNVPGRRIRRLLRLPIRPGQVAGEVDEELRFHLDMRVLELVGRGMTPEAAQAEALRQFGDVDEARRYCRTMDELRGRETRRAEWWEEAWRDVRLAMRGLARRPLFTATIVLVLALGIGANITMFGIVDRLLLRAPAHVSHPDLLKRVYFTRTDDGSEETGASASYPLYRALATRLPSAQSTGAFWTIQLVLGEGEASRRATVTLATASFLPTLGVRPQLGRLFTSDEDQAPLGSAVAVISDALWQGTYGESPRVLEQQLVVAGRAFQIVGVAPPEFSDVNLERVDAWIPLSAMAGELLDGRFSDVPWYQAVNIGFLHTVVRLPQAEAREAVQREGTAAYRATLADRWGAVRADSLRPHASLEPLLLERGPDRSASSSVAVWLAGMSLVVLLIACANVANLLLARALGRRREIAVRIALGARRGRVIRQLLAEGVVLALLGGGAAVLMAEWGGGFLQALLLPDVAWAPVVADPLLLLSAAGMALLTGIVTGLVPALQVSLPDLAGSLKSGAREGGGQRAFTRRMLVAAQAALCVVLLAGAGVFLRSLHNVRSLPLGYAADQVLTVEADLTGSGYSAEETLALHDRLLERVTAVPGVRSAALAVTTPFSSTLDTEVGLPGRDSIALPPSGPPLVNAVSSAYFETLQTPIVRGRAIGEQDRLGAEPVVVVNEFMARALWPGRDAIGECVVLIEQPGKPCLTVVGIARAVAWNAFREEPRMQMYVPLAQKTYNFALRSLYVRGDGDPMMLARSVREAVVAEEPRVRHVQIQPLAANHEREMRSWRLGAVLFTIFGGLALLLAALGLYSVIAYNVAQRMHEMGVRVALGARSGDIVRLVVLEGVRMAAAGIVIGALGVVLAGRWMAELLFETTPWDPMVLGSVVFLLLVVAVAASFIPAARATRVAPGVALRVD